MGRAASIQVIAAGRRKVGVRAAMGLCALLLVMAPGSAPVAGADGADAADAVPNSCPTRPPEHSVARLWDEAALDAIRHDLPDPTKHARTLFHLSAGMWDAWAAYDPAASGVFVTEKLEAANPARARDRAVSFAAFRILRHRFAGSVGEEASFAGFERLMSDLCLRADRTGIGGRGPAALGNRIAAAVIAAGVRDGARERRGYEPRGYASVNEPLIVKRPGTAMADPDRWQPLALDEAISQNGLPLPSGVQAFVGPHWGDVRSFGLPEPASGMPIDPGPPPRFADPMTREAFKAGAVEVIRASSQLDPSDPAAIDISPGSMGDSALGTNDGDGYDLNPFSGRPYEPNVVLVADFARVLAEFWADGPRSETPPGHWNVIANEVTSSTGFDRRWGGEGEPLDALDWDVRMYLALNGALHDAAVAAWGVKGRYDTARPISMIRYLGGLGQSGDPAGPAYHPDGLPLEPGLIEVITEESSASGARHAHLADFVGQIAVRSWLGVPEDPETQTGGVGWIRAVEWMPYQLPTFVTPAFAGYVSGHSTFSRAAAIVMTEMTGSEYFPGGLSEWTVPAGELDFEAGPSRDVTLQWATYFDAADQAGLSRIFGGIHPPWDDVAGRRIGAECGRIAWELANTYIQGRSQAEAS
jgi:hypothetical protein